MGVASLVLGIVSIVLSLIPCGQWLALLLSIVGIVLGAVARSKNKKDNQPTGAATAGLILSIISAVISISGGVLFLVVI